MWSVGGFSQTLGKVPHVHVTTAQKETFSSLSLLIGQLIRTTERQNEMEERERATRGWVKGKEGKKRRCLCLCFELFWELRKKREWGGGQSKVCCVANQIGRFVVLRRVNSVSLWRMVDLLATDSRSGGNASALVRWKCAFFSFIRFSLLGWKNWTFIIGSSDWGKRAGTLDSNETGETSGKEVGCVSRDGPNFFVFSICVAQTKTKREKKKKCAFYSTTSRDRREVMVQSWIVTSVPCLFFIAFYPQG